MNTPRPIFRIRQCSGLLALWSIAWAVCMRGTFGFVCQGIAAAGLFVACGCFVLSVINSEL